MKSERTTKAVSRRDMLKIFAAGASAAVGSIALSPLGAIARAQDNTLRMAFLTPATLDPRSASGDSEIAILNALYDYLIDTDAAGNLVPRLAHGWDISEDGTNITLHIRDDAVFHDGSPLTVDDALWTINWQREAEGTVAGLLSAAQSIEAAGDTQSPSSSTRPTPTSSTTLATTSSSSCKPTRRKLALPSMARDPSSWTRCCPATAPS